MRDDAVRDASLDEEIAQAVRVDPSPEFVARIRQRLDAEHLARAWAWSWKAWTMVAGGVLAAAMGFVVARRETPVTQDMRALTARPIPMTGTLQVLVSGAPLFDIGSVVGPDRAGQMPRARRGAGAEPDILVDPREARAVRSLIEGVASGRIDLSALLEAPMAPVMMVEPTPFRPIDIAPIELSPLAGAEQGVSQ